MERYIYSDLALENFGIGEKTKNFFNQNDVEGFSEYERNGARICRAFIDDDIKARRYKCRKGTYITVFCDNISELDTLAFESLSDEMSMLLRGCIENKLSRTIDYKTKILVVGLGNPDIVTDSIGPETVSRINVTGHIGEFNETALKRLGSCRVFAISSGVKGSTGMASAAVIKGISGECSPDIIIAVDSLAARDSSRLAATVQITDNGISPGSGINNTQAEISERTLGVPVIAVGIPTVIDSATLVCDSLRRAGIKEISEDLKLVLEGGKRFFVAPKECDIITKSSALLLSSAIDKAFRVQPKTVI